jgi:AcrR family transcriptional regulator
MTTDRRVQRSRALLQHALIDLIGERRYADITIQAIVDRANVGRTTFYLHYTSKDDLFLSCHEAIISELQAGPRQHHPSSRDELLSPDAPASLIATYQHLHDAWERLAPIFRSKDGPLILRRIHDASALQIEASLRSAFAGTTSSLPLDVLAHYLAGAQLALVQWWLEQPHPYTAQAMAQTFHRLQAASIREAFFPIHVVTPG